MQAHPVPRDSLDRSPAVAATTAGVPDSYLRDVGFVTASAVGAAGSWMSMRVGNPPLPSPNSSETATKAIRPLAEPGWYNAFPETGRTDGGCRGTVAPPDWGNGTACDEFPWFATEEGGPSSEPFPNLRIINYIDNSGSGGEYGSFIGAGSGCAMGQRKASSDPQYGKGKFLVIPLPSSLPDDTPSLPLCNGPNP